MAKKVVKKTKIKVFNLFLVLFVLIGLFFGGKIIYEAPIKNYIITGTTYLKDDYILELGNLKNYPKFLFLNREQVSKKITKSEYIEDCKIKKKWGFILELDITENRPLIYDMNQEKYVLEHNRVVEKNEISKSFRVPRLLNYVPDTKFEKFVKGMTNVKQDTLSKISDIEYQPNDYDKDRFLLYMDDGNMVYLTLTKFKMINQYNNVLSQLEGHKGILYLDSGNHFQIKE